MRRTLERAIIGRCAMKSSNSASASLPEVLDHPRLVAEAGFGPAILLCRIMRPWSDERHITLGRRLGEIGVRPSIFVCEPYGIAGHRKKGCSRLLIETEERRCAPRTLPERSRRDRAACQASSLLQFRHPDVRFPVTAEQIEGAPAPADGVGNHVFREGQ